MAKKAPFYYNFSSYSDQWIVSFTARGIVLQAVGAEPPGCSCSTSTALWWCLLTAHTPFPLPAE